MLVRTTIALGVAAMLLTGALGLPTRLVQRMLIADTPVCRSTPRRSKRKPSLRKIGLRSAATPNAPTIRRSR